MTTLLLPMPPSVNALYGRGPKNGQVYIKPGYRAWKQAAAWELFQQRRTNDPVFRGRYNAHLTLSSFGRRGDCDNRIKPVLDLLVNMGVTSDDRLCEKATAEWGDAPKGMCRVVITPVEAA